MIMTSTSCLHTSQKLLNYEEVSMQQCLVFSDSLKDLKNLRSQLYSAAKYFELSYTNDDQKQIVLETLKNYTARAVFNTVDHLGSATYKVNDYLDEKVDEACATEQRVSCVEQRLRTCKEYIDHGGISQQSLITNIPKYHKKYVLPVGPASSTQSVQRGCSVDNRKEWHRPKNYTVQASIRETPPLSIRKARSSSPSRLLQRLGSLTFSGTTPVKALGFTPEKRAASPYRFPPLRCGNLPDKLATPNIRRPPTPKTSPAKRHPSEPKKSFPTCLLAKKERHKEADEQQLFPAKSKHLLKTLLTRRTSKNDDNLYRYLDEY